MLCVKAYGVLYGLVKDLEPLI